MKMQTCEQLSTSLDCKGLISFRVLGFGGCFGFKHAALGFLDPGSKLSAAYSVPFRFSLRLAMRDTVRGL